MVADHLEQRRKAPDVVRLTERQHEAERSRASPRA